MENFKLSQKVPDHLLTIPALGGADYRHGMVDIILHNHDVVLETEQKEWVTNPSQGLLCPLTLPASQNFQKRAVSQRCTSRGWRTHFVFAEYGGVIHDPVCVCCIPGYHNDPKVPNNHFHLKRGGKGGEGRRNREKQLW